MSVLLDSWELLCAQVVPATVVLSAAWVVDRLAAGRLAPACRPALWWLVLAR